MKCIVIAMMLPGLLFADFRYEQTTRVTKGIILRMPFGKKPEPTTTTHYFKGGRMATMSADHRTIIDFDKQLFTTINVKERQYSQLTFAEMQQKMAELQEEMKDVGKGKGGELEMKFDAKATGVEKEVGGFKAKEMIFTVEMAASDGKSSGTMMIIKNDSWHSESVTGYKEYRAFFERMKDKGSWLNLNQMRAQMGGQKGMAEGMKKMAEEMQKTPGIPVLTISRVTLPGMQMPEISSNNEQQGNQQVNSQTVGDAAKQAGGEVAGGSLGRAIGGPMGGMLGGALGGRMGGFGKKKKEDPPPAQEAPKQVTPPPPPANSADGGLMMETVSDSSGFSTEAIGEDVFQVPPGYAKMDMDLGKRRKR